LGVFRYSLSDAESCQFRYILTQTPSDLQLYSKLMDQVTDSFTEIRKLTADIPLQQQYLDHMEPLLKAKEQAADKSFDMEKSGNHAGAMQIIASDAGRQNMLDIEKTVENMQSVEVQVLAARQFASSHNLKVSCAVSVASVALCLGCIVGILLLLRRLERLQSAVTLEALTEMISYEDGTLTIEEYLRRRAEALATHGKAQIEAERLLSQLERRKARSATKRVRPV
jgi:CHASE3 domain sensor protein